MTIFPNDRVWTPGRIKKERRVSLRGGVGGRSGGRRSDREGHEKQRKKGVKNVIFMLDFSLCPAAELRSLLSVPVIAAPKAISGMEGKTMGYDVDHQLPDTFSKLFFVQAALSEDGGVLNLDPVPQGGSHVVFRREERDRRSVNRGWRNCHEEKTWEISKKYWTAAILSLVEAIPQ